MQENRVIMRAVGLQHGGQFEPDGPVAAFVFGLVAGVHTHYKGFANHGGNIVV
jgi:LytS/YehU family sensor histidine kinase